MKSNSMRRMLRCKIHRATVTHADLEYEGSITIPPDLLEAAGLAEFEAVNVWNITNGNRLETYTIRGLPGSRSISINGAAAHLTNPGDMVIIAAFEWIDGASAETHKPTVVFVDSQNRIQTLRPEVAGPERFGAPSLNALMEDSHDTLS